MTIIEQEQLNVEIAHIFDSGANEIRVFEMIKSFIEQRDSPSCKRFVVCHRVEYSNDLKVISTDFESIEDAESFRETMKKSIRYENTSLMIINNC